MYFSQYSRRLHQAVDSGYLPISTKTRDGAVTRLINVGKSPPLLLQSELVFKTFKASEMNIPGGISDFRGYLVHRIYNEFREVNQNALLISRSLWRLVPDLNIIDILERYCQSEFG